MKKRNVFIVLGFTALLAIVCILVAGGVVYWALNNPTISASLNQLTSSLSDMVKLQQEITVAYPADAVRVGSMNGHILTISLVNSAANKLSQPEQKARAQEVAIFARNHYAHLNGIDTIQIALVQQSGAFGITMNFTNNYVFKLAELPQN